MEMMFSKGASMFSFLAESDPSKPAEVEPSVAVNPTDPRNVVVAWQQDRFQDGAAWGSVSR